MYYQSFTLQKKVYSHANSKKSLFEMIDVFLCRSTVGKAVETRGSTEVKIGRIPKGHSLHVVESLQYDRAGQ